MKQKKILIVGAGITGSTLACLLEDHGIIPTIIDIAHPSDTDGYGITIMPQGLKILESLGLVAKMKRVGNILKGCKLFDEDERQLNSFRLSSAGIKSITLSRGDLLSIVREQLAHTKIQWQTSVNEFSYAENGVSVSFTNGHREMFDLVIGADGINSIVRSKIFPDSKPEKVGAGIWMLSLPKQCKVDDQQFGHLVFGNYRFMAVFPYKETAAVAYTMPLNIGANPNTVNPKRAFTGMSLFSDEILETMDRSKLYCGHLHQLRLDSWYKGRVLLAGDAAHATLPATGMGASNGIQDAAVLAELIYYTPLDTFDRLPIYYEKRRKHTMKKTQREAYKIGNLMLLHGRRANLRNFIFKRIPRSILGKLLVRT